MSLLCARHDEGLGAARKPQKRRIVLAQRIHELKQRRRQRVAWTCRSVRQCVAAAAGIDCVEFRIVILSSGVSGVVFRHGLLDQVSDGAGGAGEPREGAGQGR